MMCPLILASPVDYLDTDCRKKQCAWWIESCGKCALKSLAETAQNKED